MKILYYIEGTEIEKVHVSKFLGIIINDKLSWRDHVANKISKDMGIWLSKEILYSDNFTEFILHIYLSLYLYTVTISGVRHDKYIEKNKYYKEQLSELLQG